MVPEAEKQARISQSWKARGHCSPSPRDSVCPQTVSGWPTVSPTSSWDPGQPSSARRVTAWVQLPWGNACPPGTLPSQLSRSPSSLALGDACPPWAVATTCGPATEDTLHMPAALAMSLSFHSTAEQVSPNEMPPSPSHVRAESRHWREAWKQRRATCAEQWWGASLEAAGANKIKPFH